MQYFKTHWQQLTWLSALLLPFSLLYYCSSLLRRFFFTRGILKTIEIKAPVIIIGNVSVGGTGKTPLVIWIVKLLQKNNFNPGVITRGYGRKNDKKPLLIKTNNTPSDTGDEPAIIYNNCNCPVMVDANRARGAQKLVTEHKCDIIISDDGLQHYKLGRDIEIGVVDGVRGHGNKLCLPAGPLREPASRLNKVDLVVVNNQGTGFGYKNEFKMTLEADRFINVFDRKNTKKLDNFNEKYVHVLAGIGNPEQFFSKLDMLGLKLICHPFPDHYRYTTQDILFKDYPVIMTEKDAVKLWANKEIVVPNKEQYWYLPVKANLPQEFEIKLLDLIQEKMYGQ